MDTSVRISMGPIFFEGDLHSSESAAGAILFAHGSGSSRHSPRNRFVATSLQGAGFATLLMDLLTRDEETKDQRSGRMRFAVRLLAERLLVTAGELSDQAGGRPDLAGDLVDARYGADPFDRRYRRPRRRFTEPASAGTTDSRSDYGTRADPRRDAPVH